MAHFHANGAAMPKLGFGNFELSEPIAR